MAADEIKICPILPLMVKGPYDSEFFREPRLCYGERCAWFLSGECGIAGIALAMAAVGRLSLTLLEEGIVVRKGNAPDMQQGKGNGSDG